MHIRDGILSPEVCAATGVMALAAVGFSLRKLRTDLEDRSVPLTGMMSAIVFAAQMVNFPLFGLPVSGHLLGGVLAAVVLGPWAGCLAMSLVLLVQAVLFNDGGLMSLGANIVNMSVIGGWGGYAIFSLIRKWLGTKPMSAVPAAVIAAWVSVLAAAAMFCIEFSLSTRSTDFSLRGIFTLMVFYHALIGIGEALITGGILSFVLARKPDLISATSQSTPVANFGRFVASGLIVALAVSAFLAPFKSEFPDGLDAVATAAGFASLEFDRPGPLLNDYEIPMLDCGAWPAMATSLAGVLGTCVVFATALILGKAARWNVSRLMTGGGHAG